MSSNDVFNHNYKLYYYYIFTSLEDILPLSTPLSELHMYLAFQLNT